MSESSYQSVLNEIQKACEKAERASASVRLLAVSKTKTMPEIEQVFSQGQRLFGENYVQELLEKIAYQENKPELQSLQWHFIGHLQTNKVNQIVGKVTLIHSVGSLKLAAKISKRALEQGIDQAILLEVNLGDEDSKSGFSVQQLRVDFPALLQLPNLKLQGLMSLPPLDQGEHMTRIYFMQLRSLLQELGGQIPKDQAGVWRELSMGTTSDFKIAIEEGSTIVRIGTAIFGKRNN